MNLDKINRDDWLLAGIATLLVIDLLFLPWFDISVGPLSFTSTATDAPDGWPAVLAVLAAIALIADLSVERLSPQTSVPAIGESRTMTRLVLAGIVALFVALKFLLDIHFSLFGFGFWAGIVLSAALVVIARRAHGSEPLVFSSRSA